MKTEMKNLISQKTKQNNRKFANRMDHIEDRMLVFEDREGKLDFSVQKNQLSSLSHACLARSFSDSVGFLLALLIFFHIETYQFGETPNFEIARVKQRGNA